MTRCPLCRSEVVQAALPEHDPNFSFVMTAIRTGHLCAGCLCVLGKDTPAVERVLPILSTHSEHRYWLCEVCAATAREFVDPFLWHLVTTLGAGGHG